MDVKACKYPQVTEHQKTWNVFKYEVQKQISAALMTLLLQDQSVFTILK